MRDSSLEAGPLSADSIEGRVHPRPLSYRIGLLAGLLILEIVGFSVAFDTASLSRFGFVGFIGDWSPIILRAAIAFVVLFAFLLVQTSPGALRELSDRLPRTFVSAVPLVVHAAAMLTLFALSRIFFGNTSPGIPRNLMALAWLVAGMIGVAAGVATFVPLRLLAGLMRGTAHAWIPAFIGGVLTCAAGYLAQRLWLPAQNITFHLAADLLRPVISNLFLDPAHHAIGTQKFSVEIAPDCSGLEGVGLMLVFSAVWIWLCRRECRFPQVLLIVPASAILIFLLNSVRIATLILIGNAGAPDIAVGGFHSQAGWITFNATAIGLMLMLRQVPWFVTQRAPVEYAPSQAADPTIWYLAPFLAILVAAMISKAASSEFEYLYPLRLLTGAAVLFAFRRHYSDLDWRVGWAGPVAGVSVFAIWSGWDLMHPSASGGAVSAALNSLPAWTRLIWISCRILAPILPVPVAEELAFRGYLTRRLISENFSGVDFRTIGPVAILASSAAFGAMHGSRWPVGILAGVIYALALRQRGRIGDAVAAHCITNGLLAVQVVATGQWDLW